MVSAAILFITTDPETPEKLQRIAANVGADLHVADSLPAAVDALARDSFDAVLVELDAFGTGMHRGLLNSPPLSEQTPVIVLGREDSIPAAVRAARAGAYDYVKASPSDTASLRDALRSALSAVPAAASSPEGGGASVLPFDGFITAHHDVLSACRTLAGVAGSDIAVLIEGEVGTGKTLLAEKLHENSLRRLAPFVEVHCSALTDAQVERELFGDEGAVQEAVGGTLLLSDLARCSTPLQGKLVRILGDSARGLPRDEHGVDADLRLVVANTVSDDEPAGPAACREALRLLSPVEVVLPPLRDRCADIPLLVRHFACVLSRRHGHRAPRFRPDALASLVRHSWPGNVRELKNAVQHAVMLAADGVIGREHLPESVDAGRSLGPGEDPQGGLLNLEPAMRQAERRYLLHALRLCHWNKRKAAQELQISRSTLYKKVKQHGLKELKARGGPEPAAGAASG